jgi:hypothetical protein
MYPVESIRANTQQSDLESKLYSIETLLRLNLLTAGGTLPITNVGSAFNGAVIGTTSRYVEIYKNNYKHMLAIRIFAEFDTVTPGIQKASLALTNDLSNYSRIDLLIEGLKDRSDTVWLRPNQSLYINTADTAVDLSGSIFRTLVFDPLALADYINQVGA